MKRKVFQVRRLDVTAFAHQQGQLSGTWPAASLDRLAHSVLSLSEGGVVTWALSGQIRRAADQSTQVWLHAQAETAVLMRCQRCLQPVSWPVHVARWFRFVATEAQADEVDLSAEEDVLCVSHSLDAQSLLEDELLMALPMVPMHPDCEPPHLRPPQGSGAVAPPGDDEEPSPNPFAALAGLKRRH